MKLDFKSPSAVEFCLQHIAQNSELLSSTPLWLNADIWNGPGGPPSPFDQNVFVAQCLTASASRPVTLSLGWTTRGFLEPYTALHIDEAIASLKSLGILLQDKAGIVQCTYL